MREVRRELRRLSDDSKNELKTTHKEAAELVARQARFLVPVRSGRLLASVRATSTTTKGQVRAGGGRVRYAGPIHFGWPGRPNRAKGWRGGPIAPQPFIYEAADRRIGDVVTLYERRLTDLIRQHGLD